MKTALFAKILPNGSRFLGALLLTQAMVSGQAYAETCPQGSLCFWDFDDDSNMGTVEGN